MNTNLLFPISLGNKVFETKLIIESIKVISNKKKIYFLIPDSLSFYNHVRNTIPKCTLSESFLDFNGQDFYNSVVWINKLIIKLNRVIPDKICELLLLSNYIDKSYFECYRKIQILHSISKKFEADICEAIDNYLSRNSFKNNQINKELSKQFLMEELTASIIIKSKFGIRDEYYIGRSLALFMNFFDNKYEIGFNDMVPDNNSIPFNYFTFNLEKSIWINEKKILAPSF